MKKYFILAILFLSCLSLSAQDKNNFEFSIDSQAFGKERKVSVFLPDRYLQNPNDSFGIIFMLDAQSSSVWNMAKSNINYLVNQHQIIPTIVVGIHTESRQKEFLPDLKSEKTHPSNRDGTALLLQKHIADEILPLVSSKFRTNEFRVLIGHSRAGYFVAHTLFSEYSDLFNAYIMISPGLHYLDEKVLKDADKELRSKSKIGKFLFASVGTVGSTDHFFEPYVEKLDSIIMANPNTSLRWKKEILSGYNHFTGVIPAINNGLVEMSKNYMITDYLVEEFANNDKSSMQEQIKKHKRKGLSELGYAIATSADQIRYFGDEFREEGNDAIAWDLYNYALELSPSDFKIYRTMGWAYMDKGENEKAFTHLQKALDFLALEKEVHEKDSYERIKSGIERTIVEVKAR